MIRWCLTIPILLLEIQANGENVTTNESNSTSNYSIFFSTTSTQTKSPSSLGAAPLDSTIYDDSIPLEDLTPGPNIKHEEPEEDDSERPYSMDDNLDDTTTLCVCEQAIVLYSLNSSTQFQNDKVEYLAKTLTRKIADKVLNESLVLSRMVDLPKDADRCDALRNSMEQAPGNLVINIDPGTDQTCRISKRLVMQTPLIEFNAFAPNDSENWFVTFQSKSTYLKYQLQNIHGNDDMEIITFLIKATCAPTLGRSNLSEEYSRLQWSEVEARYTASLPAYGVIAGVATCMTITGFWMCGVFIYRTIENAELKEQRAIRLYIAELVKKEHEREEQEERARLAEMIKNYKKPAATQTNPSNIPSSNVNLYCFRLMAPKKDGTPSRKAAVSTPKSESRVTRSRAKVSAPCEPTSIQKKTDEIVGRLQKMLETTSGLLELWSEQQEKFHQCVQERKTNFWGLIDTVNMKKNLWPFEEFSRLLTRNQLTLFEEVYNSFISQSMVAIVAICANDKAKRDMFLQVGEHLMAISILNGDIYPALRVLSRMMKLEFNFRTVLATMGMYISLDIGDYFVYDQLKSVPQKQTTETLLQWQRSMEFWAKSLRRPNYDASLVREIQNELLLIQKENSLTFYTSYAKICLRQALVNESKKPNADISKTSDTLMNLHRIYDSCYGCVSAVFPESVNGEGLIGLLERKPDARSFHLLESVVYAHAFMEAGCDLVMGLVDAGLTREAESRALVNLGLSLSTCFSYRVYRALNLYYWPKWRITTDRPHLEPMLEWFQQLRMPRSSSSHQTKADPEAEVITELQNIDINTGFVSYKYQYIPKPTKSPEAHTIRCKCTFCVLRTNQLRYTLTELRSERSSADFLCSGLSKMAADTVLKAFGERISSLTQERKLVEDEWTDSVMKPFVPLKLLRVPMYLLNDFIKSTNASNLGPLERNNIISTVLRAFEESPSNKTVLRSIFLLFRHSRRPNPPPFGFKWLKNKESSRIDDKVFEIDGKIFESYTEMKEFRHLLYREWRFEVSTYLAANCECLLKALRPAHVALYFSESMSIALRASMRRKLHRKLEYENMKRDTLAEYDPYPLGFIEDSNDIMNKHRALPTDTTIIQLSFDSNDILWLIRYNPAQEEIFSIPLRHVPSAGSLDVNPKEADKYLSKLREVLTQSDRSTRLNSDPKSFWANRHELEKSFQRDTLAEYDPYPLGFIEDSNDIMNKHRALPTDTTIIQLSFDSNDILWLIRYNPAQEEIFSIPLRHVPSAGSLDVNPKEADKYLSKLREVLTQSDRSTRLNSDPKSFWANRHELEKSFQIAMFGLENEWIDYFAPLFKPISTRSTSHPQFRSAMKGFMLCGYSQTVAMLLTLGVFHSKDEESFRTLAEVLTERISPFTSKKQPDSTTVLQLYKKHRPRLTAVCKELSEEDSFLFLSVPGSISFIPWEAMKVFENVLVSRIASLQIFDVLKARHKKLPTPIDLRNSYYVLNPSGDLVKTEERFKTILNNSSWTGMTGAPPPKGSVLTTLEHKDIYMYVGHGNGLKYAGTTSELQKTECKASCILMGCSSVEILDEGRGYDGRALLYDLVVAHCPCVVGCLYMVTDGEIDAVFMEMLRYLNQNREEEKTESGRYRLLLRAVKHARGSCRLKMLTGHAVVCYGLPTSTENPDPQIASSIPASTHNFLKTKVERIAV
uniref:separase n=1 Tax=Bursaphelenchus xylophilus TaxID=6326 RepID=A0A1I7S2M8_BURXY